MEKLDFRNNSIDCCEMYKGFEALIGSTGSYFWFQHWPGNLGSPGYEFLYEGDCKVPNGTVVSYNRK
eukprot:Pgem_evm1s1046